MKRILYFILLIVYSLNLFSQEDHNDENNPDSAKEYKYSFRYCVDERSLNEIEDEE